MTTKRDRRRRRREKTAAREARTDIELTYPVICSPDQYEEAREHAERELVRLGAGRLVGAPHVRTFIGAGEALAVLATITPETDPGPAAAEMVTRARELGDTAVLHLATARLRKRTA